MTVADPYPETLAELDEAPIAVNQDAVTNRLIAAVNRLAQALEQNTLAILDRPAQNGSGRPLTALPPVQTTAPQAVPVAGVCPIHNVPWKTVPAGVSKKTGQPYSAFAACSVSGCDQRPPR